MKTLLILPALLLAGCTGLTGLSDAVVGVMPENAKQIIERNGNNLSIILVNSQQSSVFPLTIELDLGHAHTGQYCDTGERIFDINVLVAQMRPEETQFWQDMNYELLSDPDYFQCGSSYSCRLAEVPGVGTYSEIPGYGIEVYADCTLR